MKAKDERQSQCGRGGELEESAAGIFRVGYAGYRRHMRASAAARNIQLPSIAVGKYIIPPPNAANFRRVDQLVRIGRQRRTSQAER